MKTRIKRKSVDVRIFDVLRALHGTYKAEKKYKYIMFKTELQTIKTA